MTGFARVARGRFHRGIPDLTGLSAVLHFRFETAPVAVLQSAPCSPCQSLVSCALVGSFGRCSDGFQEDPPGEVLLTSRGCLYSKSAPANEVVDATGIYKYTDLFSRSEGVYDQWRGFISRPMDIARSVTSFLIISRAMSFSCESKILRVSSGTFKPVL